MENAQQNDHILITGVPANLTFFFQSIDLAITNLESYSRKKVLRVV